MVFWAFGIKDRRQKHTENSSFLQDLAWIMLVFKSGNVLLFYKNDIN